MGSGAYRRQIAKWGMLLLASIAVIIIQYYLANRPVAVDVNAYKFTPAKARLNQEQLVIENPVFDSTRILFSVDSKMNEFVDIHFENARLSQETLELFASQPEPAPAGLETIDFITEDVKRKLDELMAKKDKLKPQNSENTLVRSSGRTNGDQNGTCLIFVKAEVAADSKLPTRESFYQEKGSDSTRDFYMSVDADLFVSMKISPLINKDGSIDPLTPGCGKLLKIGKTWEWHNAGFWEIKVIASANSILHFTILQHQPDSLWRGSKDLFQPFTFGSRPLKAKAVSINALTGNRPPTLRASAREASSLDINSLMVNAEEIQVDFAGTAWVKTNGEDVTSSYFELVKKYPFTDAAVTALIMAVLAWFTGRLKGTFTGQRNKA